MRLNTNMFNLIKQIFDAAEKNNAVEVARLKRLAKDEYLRVHFPSFETWTYTNQDNAHAAADEAINKTIMCLAHNI